MSSSNYRSDPTFLLKLLKFGAFERRPRGGWRFGTKTMSNDVVARLIASDHAEIVDGRLQLKRREARALALAPETPR
jgi:hypothetical protein